MNGVARALAVAALLAAAAGCRKAPSVVVISIDSFRADAVAMQVNGHPVAPRIAAFARESVDYTDVTSAAPWTSPSMMAVMTGLVAPAHGLEEHDRALAAGVPTLAEAFHAAGYRTAAVVPALTLRPEYGFGRGFDTFDYQPFGHDVITSPQLTGKVLQQLERLRGERFFLWVHFWDPHYNYIPPQPWSADFAHGSKPARDDVQCLKWIENPLRAEEADWLKGQWAGEVNYTDRHVGEILDQVERLGLSRDTIVVVLGDHGEAFQEHGWLGHTVRVDEEMVRVPLLIRWPARLAPARLTQPVELARLAPTLAALAQLGGRPLGDLPPLPTAAGADAGAHGILTETLRMGCFTGWREGTSAYQIDHRSCRESLFDLAADPGERHDRSADDPATLLRLRRALAARLAAVRALHVPRAALPPALVNEAEAALRSIGYVAGKGAPGGGDIVCAALPDPRTLRHDAFGDFEVYKPCDPDGAAACLARLGAAPAPQ